MSPMAAMRLTCKCQAGLICLKILAILSDTHPPHWQHENIRHGDTGKIKSGTVGRDEKQHLQCSELVEMCGKERGAADRLHEVLGDGPGQAKAVVRACAPPQLVNDHQRLGARPLPHPRPGSHLCSSLPGPILERLSATHIPAIQQVAEQWLKVQSPRKLLAEVQSPRIFLLKAAILFDTFLVLELKGFEASITKPSNS